VTYDDLPSRLIGPDPVFRHPAPYALIRVSGPDSRDFLQRMCSQDISGMVDGEVRPAAFLNGKGRLLAICDATVQGENVWLSTQIDTAPSLAEMLERYHFSEQLTVSLLDVECAEVVQVGDAGGSVSTDPAGTEIMLAFGRGGVRRMRIHAPAEFLAGGTANPESHPSLDPAVADVLRIATGEPWVGKDSEANTIALELPIDDHISLTKGCYTGQEIVARIHTYGHTNRSLCKLGIAGVGAIETGTMLIELDEGDPVGRVMSSAEIPGAGNRIAFGFLASALTDPGTKLALGDRDGAEVVVLP
jgi:folate-binding protein YgfZ